MLLRHVIVTSSLLLVAGCAAAAPTYPPATAGPAPSPTSAATAGAATPGPSRTPAPAAARCVAADLKLTLATAPAPPAGQVTVPLRYTNASGRTCVLTGVPGVDLRGPADPTFGPVYSLPRSGVEKPQQQVTLRPGAAAAAPLSYLADPAGWVPQQLVTTPPGDTRQLTIDWSGGGVTRQDGATHPGTFVGPLAPA